MIDREPSHCYRVKNGPVIKQKVLQSFLRIQDCNYVEPCLITETLRKGVCGDETKSSEQHELEAYGLVSTKRPDTKKK